MQFNASSLSLVNNVLVIAWFFFNFHPTLRKNCKH